MLRGQSRGAKSAKKPGVGVTKSARLDPDPAELPGAPRERCPGPGISSGVLFTRLPTYIGRGVQRSKTI